ncbi:hypothetical protein BCR34DRAFT_604568 [Clohesyomyces aquaticus]|uniref:Uncharacterized protein n=1 Tax=Clohesyomyces aquaticus TaxID=1231657 RepID=A0A1Y1Z503_9PLEO|nr:hypothetical protein BCR34DRAFT_604568 [Clohesyomyces aquaticus]
MAAESQHHKPPPHQDSGFDEPSETTDLGPSGRRSPEPEEIPLLASPVAFYGTALRSDGAAQPREIISIWVGFMIIIGAVSWAAWCAWNIFDLFGGKHPQHPDRDRGSPGGH